MIKKIRLTPESNRNFAIDITSQLSADDVRLLRILSYNALFSVDINSMRSDFLKRIVSNANWDHDEQRLTGKALRDLILANFNDYKCIKDRD